MTASELVERAIRLIHPAPTEEQQVGLRTALLTKIDNALYKLAELTTPSNLLRKTVTVTAASGEASLATPLAATEPILLSGVKRAQVFIDGFTHAAQWKADRSSLALPMSSQFAAWTLENQTIVIRDSAGLGNYDGNVVVRNVPYVPLLVNVPVTLQPLLVEVLAAYGQPAEMAAKNA